MAVSDQEVVAQAALARMLLQAGRAAEALQAAEMALALDPDDAEARVVQAEATLVMQTMDPALAVLELALVLRPGDPAPALELGHSYAELGRPQAAERAFKRALGAEPGNPQAHAGLGALYLSVDMGDAAEHHSRAALTADPGHAVASQTLATILEARGSHAEAEALLDRAYDRQSLFLEPARDARMTVLVLATRSSGNIPYRFLMPPRLYSRLVWYMEHARPEQLGALPRHDAVLNAIGDADLAEPSAQAVGRFLAASHRRVLNAPDRVALTRRDRLPHRLEGLDRVVAPRAVRVAKASGEALIQAALAAGITAPLLARPVGSHGGAGLVRVDCLDALRSLGDAFAGQDVYLTQFHAYQSDDGRYRKGRVIFVDRRPFPYHWAVADSWLVHYETAGMDGAGERQLEERLFLSDPESVIGQAAWRAVAAIGERLDLDYAGLDFSVLPDGQLLVFEANATMLAHPEPEDGELAYKNPAVSKIVEAFQILLAMAADA